MPEPCKQEPHLRIIDQRWASVEKELVRVAEAMEKLAEQRVEIEHLTEQQKDTRSWLKDHEQRIQVLEKAPGNAAGKFLWVVLASAVTVGPGIAIGLTLWLIKGAS